MSLADSLRSLIRICQYCGLAPLLKNKITQKWELSPFLEFVSIIYMIFYGVLSVLMVVRIELFLDYNDNLLNVDLLLLLLLFNHFHAVSVLLEMHIKRDQQVQLLNTFENLDNLLRQHISENVNYENIKSKCQRIIIVWTCELTCILISDLFNYFLLYSGRTSQIVYLGAYLSSYTFGKLSYAYAIMLITIIRDKLDLMSTYLRSVNKPYGYYVCQQFSNLTHNNYGRLIPNKIDLSTESMYSMKNVYSVIWVAIESIKNLNRWSFLIGLSNEFFVLTFNLYVLISSIFFISIPITSYVLLSILIANNLCNLVFIASHCSKMVEGVSKYTCNNNKKNKKYCKLTYLINFDHLIF